MDRAIVCGFGRSRLTFQLRNRKLDRTVSSRRITNNDPLREGKAMPYEGTGPVVEKLAVGRRHEVAQIRRALGRCGNKPDLGPDPVRCRPALRFIHNRPVTG